MSKSTDAYAQAGLHIPGGVNSPVRAFQGVGGEPIFFERAKGAYLYSIEGKEFVDYVGSWGPAILGHNHPEVIAAVTQAAERGLSFGAPTLQETSLAEKICALMPNIEMVRLVNSGTEACMSAIRLARAYSKRDKIVKFEGCYHGHADSLLVKAGSGALTLGVPSSPGVPAALAELTLTLPYNDLDAATKLFSEMGSEIACVIVEPVAGNMNCILPNADFLTGLRSLCDEHSSLLVFDEVMSGFRVALGGAQQHYQVKPDLTTLGKVIGGGLPVGAFGGRREIMQMLAPLGPVYQAGTLSGNPLATAAGLKTLELLSQANFYTELAEKTSRLTAGLIEIAEAAGVPLSKNQLGGMFGLFFSTTSPITSFAQVQKCDVNAFKQFFHGMLEQGIYLAPSAFEAGFVSAAHGDIELEKTFHAAKHTFSKL